MIKLLIVLMVLTSAAALSLNALSLDADIRRLLQLMLAILFIILGLLIVVGEWSVTLPMSQSSGGS